MSNYAHTSTAFFGTFFKHIRTIFVRGSTAAKGVDRTIRNQQSICKIGVYKSELRKQLEAD